MTILKKHIEAYKKSIGSLLETLGEERFLELEKVDKIVGMSNGNMTLYQVLDYRKSFYNNSYDYNFKNSGTSEKKDTFIMFLNYFIELPFVKENNIKVNKQTFENLIKKIDTREFL